MEAKGDLLVAEAATRADRLTFVVVVVDFKRKD